MKNIYLGLLLTAFVLAHASCTVNAELSANAGKSKPTAPAMTQTSNVGNPHHDTTPLPAKPVEPVIAKPTKSNDAEPNVTPSEKTTDATPGKPGSVGMPNPASENCKKAGGTLTLVDTPNGQIGVCQWADGSKCEEWRLFHKHCKQGECQDENGICDKPNTKAKKVGMANPASVFCREQGGASTKVKTAQGEIRVCQWRDASRCEEWLLYTQKCKRGDCKEQDGICDSTSGGQSDEVASPAYVYCRKMGGAVTPVKTAQGEILVCQWRDASRCELERHYNKQCKRGDCKEETGICESQGKPGAAVAIANPASVYCERNGGKLEIVTEEKGGQIGVCTFPDGSKCEEWSFFRKQCKSGDCHNKLGKCPKTNPPATR